MGYRDGDGRYVSDDQIQLDRRLDPAAHGATYQFIRNRGSWKREEFVQDKNRVWKKKHTNPSLDPNRVAVDIDSYTPLNDAFWEFHQNNPHVFDELVRLAFLAKRAGRTKIGIRMLWERLRWTLEVETNRPDGEYKLNDHLTARYARYIMDSVPELQGFFETRDRK